MTRGEQIELQITDVAFGGDGVGRTPGGQVVFVPFTATGDTVLATVVSEGQKFLRAALVEVLEPAATRAEPVCPLFGRCGGCRYQHLTAAAQVEAKLSQLNAALARIGTFGDVPQPDPVVHSPKSLGYRNKLRLEPFGDPQPTSRGDVLQYGFCSMDNVTFLHIPSCPLGAPALNDLLPKAQRSRWAHKNARRPHPYPMTLRVAADGRTEFYFGRAPRSIPWLHEQLSGRQVGVPLGSFWQTNPAVAEQMSDTIRGWFADSPTQLLTEVFAGVGALSLALGNTAEERWLIERDIEATEAAAYNHTQWSLEPCHVLAGAAEKVLPRHLAALSNARRRATTVLLDPPRAGCPKGVIKALVRRPVQQLIYVSCNPATLARDAKTLARDGHYQLRRLAFFDMFPQTAHFESAALFTR